LNPQRDTAFYFFPMSVVNGSADFYHVGRTVIEVEYMLAAVNRRKTKRPAATQQA
jgi:hypothetical protein